MFILNKTKKMNLLNWYLYSPTKLTMVLKIIVHVILVTMWQTYCYDTVLVGMYIYTALTKGEWTVCNKKFINFHILSLGNFIEILPKEVKRVQKYMCLL